MIRRMRSGAMLLALPALLAGCASAAQSLPEGALALTAHEAWAEARSQARGWSADAQLQYVEGGAVTAAGTVRSDEGYWRFVFRAPDQAEQLVVEVRPTAVEATQRQPTSPPGFLIGERTLGLDWIDSPEALSALPTFDEGTRVRMMLVPTEPARWLVTLGDERVQVNARTGVVIQ